MEFKSAIVDELGCVMYWCDELQDENQIECILDNHPEWSRKCIEMWGGWLWQNIQTQWKIIFRM